MQRTSKSKIVSKLRMLWLQSKERATALKRARYCCEECGVKASKKKGAEQKVEVHHKQGVGNWDRIVDAIQQELLCNPELLQVLCPDCHSKK